MLVLLASGAFATPTFDDTVVPYPIHGRTGAQVARNLDTQTNRPKDESGERWQALTTWHVSANWTWRSTDDTCEVDTVTVTLTTRMDAPDWTPPKHASERLIARWDSFSQGLRTHEEGHVARDHQMAIDLEATLLGLPAAPSCDTLDAAASQAVDDAIAQVKAENRDYDAATIHGQTQIPGGRY